MSQTLVDFMKSRIAMHKEATYTAIMVESMVIINDLAENGPADTGASAGRADRAVSRMKPSHPAYGMSIGNKVGESGWQMNADDYKFGAAELTVAICNPMWEPYLKYVNYGFIHAASSRKRPARHFLETAWLNHQGRGAFSWH